MLGLSSGLHSATLMRTCSKSTANQWQSGTRGPGLLTPHHAARRNTVQSQLKKERKKKEKIQMALKQIKRCYM